MCICRTGQLQSPGCMEGNHALECDHCNLQGGANYRLSVALTRSSPTSILCSTCFRWWPHAYHARSHNDASRGIHKNCSRCRAFSSKVTAHAHFLLLQVRLQDNMQKTSCNCKTEAALCRRTNRGAGSGRGEPTRNVFTAPNGHDMCMCHAY